MEVKINRKTYSINAVICDINQDILGMDFIHKYKLGLEWSDDGAELNLVDKRAQIKAALEIVTVPKNLQQTHRLESVSATTRPPPFTTSVNNQKVMFELACMKKLGEKINKKEDPEEQLKLHSEEYVKLIRERPQLIKPTFTKNPSHGIFHKIETADHTP